MMADMLRELHSEKSDEMDSDGTKVPMGDAKSKESMSDMKKDEDSMSKMKKDDKKAKSDKKRDTEKKKSSLRRTLERMLERQ